MGTKKNKKTVVDETVEAVVTVAVANEVDEVQVVKPPFGELQAMYLDALQRASEYAEMAQTAEFDRSHALQALAENYGTGPYEIGEKTVTITCRAKRDVIDPSTGETFICYFTKRLGGKDVIKLA